MKIPEELLQTEDYQQCAAFHGHVCMGLTLGYLAAKLGLQVLAEQRSFDEELICIAETDACGCDAIQVLTGCTFGKGNFLYRDIGKMAFTLASRTTGRGVRISMKPGVMDVPEPESSLAEKVRAGTASAAEIKEYEQLHEARSSELFARGAEAFFTATEEVIDLPSKARMAPSSNCSECGEPVMITKLQEYEGKLLCRSCLEDIDR